MVNMEVVKERLLRGAYVGAGSFASNFTATFIEENIGLGDMGTSIAQVGTGLTLSVGVDEVFGSPDSMPNDVVEFAGYGIQGAGWADLADSVQTGRNLSGNTVSVQSAGGRQTAQNVRVVDTEEQETNEGTTTQAPFAADVA